MGNIGSSHVRSCAFGIACVFVQHGEGYEITSFFQESSRHRIHGGELVNLRPPLACNPIGSLHQLLPTRGARSPGGFPGWQRMGQRVPGQGASPTGGQERWEWRGELALGVWGRGNFSMSGRVDIPRVQPGSEPSPKVRNSPLAKGQTSPPRSPSPGRPPSCGRSCR